MISDDNVQLKCAFKKQRQTFPIAKMDCFDWVCGVARVNKMLWWPKAAGSPLALLSALW